MKGIVFPALMDEIFHFLSKTLLQFLILRFLTISLSCVHFYCPHSEASKGYVFTGVCHSVTRVLYSGKQTDATIIEL